MPIVNFNSEAETVEVTRLSTEGIAEEEEAAGKFAWSKSLDRVASVKSIGTSVASAASTATSFRKASAQGVVEYLRERPFLPSKLVEHRPISLTCVVLAVVASVIATGFIGASISIDVGSTALIESDGETLARKNAFTQARVDRVTGRRLQGAANRFEHERVLYLTFVPADGRTLVSPRTVRTIRDVERRVKNMPSWVAACRATHPSVDWLCVEGVSLTNLAFPHTTASAKFETLYLNGTGSQAVPLGLAVEWAHQEGYSEVIFPSEVTKNATESPRLQQEACMDHPQAGDCAKLRDEGHCENLAEHELYMEEFCAATCRVCGSPVDGKPLEALRSYFSFSGNNVPWDSWQRLLGELADEMRDINSKAAVDTHGFRVFYNGDGVRNYEAVQVLQRDARLGIGAFLFIVIYLVLHTQSVVAVLAGLFLIALSFPCALAVFALVTGALHINIAVCVAGYVTLSFGSHMLLVFFTFWRLSAQREGTTRDKLGRRLESMYVQVSLSCTASAVLTTLVFFLNLTSDLRPLRELGFVTGMSIGIATLLMFSVFPVALVFSESLQQRQADKVRESIRVSSVQGNQRMMQKSTCAGGATMTTSQSASPSKAMLLAQKFGLTVLDAKSRTPPEILGDLLANIIGRCPLVITIGFAALTLTAVIVGVGDVKSDPNSPQIFRPGHNQYDGEPYETRFNRFDRMAFPNPVQPKRRCVDVSDSDAPEVCSVHGCRTFGRRLGSNTSCACMQQSISDSVSDNTCASYTVAIRVVGRQELDPSMVTKEAAMTLLQKQFGNYSRYKFAAKDKTSSIMHVGHWDSGREYIATLVTLPDASVEVVGRGWGSNKACNLAEVCYCDIERCDGTEDDPGLGYLHLVKPREGDVAGGVSGARRLQGDFGLTTEGRLDRSYAFLLSKAVVRDDLQARVSVILGVEVFEKKQLLGDNPQGRTYTFSPDFRFEDPWVQRVSLDLCHGFSQDLRITEMTCWLTGFMEWWQSRDRWPIRPERFDVNQQVLDYIAYHPVQVIRPSGMFLRPGVDDFLWLTPEGKVKAMYIDLVVDLSLIAESADILEMMGKWDAHIAMYNSQVAGRTSAAWRAWHTCDLWVRAQASEVLMSSAMIRLLIAMVCVLVGMRVIAGNSLLAIIVAIIVAASVMTTIFALATVLGWRLGAIELLALTTFVGTTADYCSHIANKFVTCHVQVDYSAQAACEAEMAPAETDDSAHIAEASTDTKAKATNRFTSVRRVVESRRSGFVCHDTYNDSKGPRVVRRIRNQLTVERSERSMFAVRRMGAAAFGSGVVTFGCAAFFIGADYAMLMRIGVAVVLVTTSATLYAIVGLPAVLMVCGPRVKSEAPKSKVERVASAIAMQARIGEIDRDDFDCIDFERGFGLGPTTYYIMHMPTKGMGAVDEGVSASRTIVDAHG